MSNSPIEDGEIRDNFVEKATNNCNQDNYESVNMEMDSDTGEFLAKPKWFVYFYT